MHYGTAPQGPGTIPSTQHQYWSCPDGGQSKIGWLNTLLLNRREGIKCSMNALPDMRLLGRRASAVPAIPFLYLIGQRHSPGGPDVGHHAFPGNVTRPATDFTSSARSRAGGRPSSPSA